MIHVITHQNTHLYHDVMDEYFRLRHKIYVEDRKWSGLRSQDGREADQFDTPAAVYLMYLYGRQIVASTRLLPTTGPHLMRDVFPHLVSIREAPQGDDTAAGFCRTIAA